MRWGNNAMWIASASLLGVLALVWLRARQKESSIHIIPMPQAAQPGPSTALTSAERIDRAQALATQALADDKAALDVVHVQKQLTVAYALYEKAAASRARLVDALAGDAVAAEAVRPLVRSRAQLYDTAAGAVYDSYYYSADGKRTLFYRDLPEYQRLISFYNTMADTWRSVA